MTGSHYTLDRDKSKPEVPKEKPCKRCGRVYPNTFEYFGKKVSGSRTNFVTNDVCAQCKHDKLMEYVNEKRRSDAEYAAYKRQQLLDKSRGQ